MAKHNRADSLSNESSEPVHKKSCASSGMYDMCGIENKQGLGYPRPPVLINRKLLDPNYTSTDSEILECLQNRQEIYLVIRNEGYHTCSARSILCLTSKLSTANKLIFEAEHYEKHVENGIVDALQKLGYEDHAQRCIKGFAAKRDGMGGEFGIDIHWDGTTTWTGRMWEKACERFRRAEVKVVRSFVEGVPQLGPAGRALNILGPVQVFVVTRIVSMTSNTEVEGVFGTLDDANNFVALLGERFDDGFPSEFLLERVDDEKARAHIILEGEPIVGRVISWHIQGKEQRRLQIHKKMLFGDDSAGIVSAEYKDVCTMKQHPIVSIENYLTWTDDGKHIARFLRDVARALPGNIGAEFEERDIWEQRHRLQKMGVIDPFKGEPDGVSGFGKSFSR